MSERCEPPPEWRDRVDDTRRRLLEAADFMVQERAVYVPDLLLTAARQLGQLARAPVTLPQTVLALVEALKHADLQLEYIDQRSPSGTTPAVRAQIDAALALYRGGAGDESA